MSLFLALMLTAPALDPFDFRALDAAIERCERETALPLFAAEAPRRSGFLTSVYEEQAAISAERLATSAKRRALREAALQPAPVAPTTPVAPAETDPQLVLQQLALDDRQRALDDRRRLEALRQEAVDVKRSYFLARCPSRKKSD